MASTFTIAQHRLAALVLERELEKLDSLTQAVGIHGWESLQDYPADTFELLHALGVLPIWAHEPITLHGSAGRGVTLKRPLKDLQNLPLTQETYDQLVRLQVRSNAYWREGIDPYYDTDMFPRPGGEQIFELLYDCGLLEPAGDKWHWVKAVHPYLRAKPVVKPVPSAAYDALPYLLRVKFEWVAKWGGVHGLARQVRLHWRHDEWRMIPSANQKALHEFGLTEWAVFAKKFLPDLR